MDRITTENTISREQHIYFVDEVVVLWPLIVSHPMSWQGIGILSFLSNQLIPRPLPSNPLKPSNPPTPSVLSFQSPNTINPLLPNPPPLQHTLSPQIITTTPYFHQPTSHHRRHYHEPFTTSSDP